jgi:hypothetical protein
VKIKEESSSACSAVNAQLQRAHVGSPTYSRRAPKRKREPAPMNGAPGVLWHQQYEMIASADF